MTSVNGVMPSGLLNQILSGVVSMDEAIEGLQFPATRAADVSVDSIQWDRQITGLRYLDANDFIKKGVGETVVIGARTGHGKSVLGFQIAANVALSAPVLAFSLEMQNSQITARLLSALGDIKFSDIKSGRADKAQLAKAYRVLQERDLFILDKEGLTVKDIALITKSYHKKYGLGMVLIDYGGKIRGERSYSRTTEIERISAELLTLAKECSIPIVIAVQVSRAAEQRGKDGGDYEPAVADVADSDSWARDASSILFINRPFQNDKKSRPGEADIILAKNRHGTVGRVIYRFDGAYMRFIDESMDF